MPDDVKLGFAAFALPARGVLVVFCNDGLQLGPSTRSLLGDVADMVRKAAAAERFKGKLGSTLDIVLPNGLQASRLVVVGCGQASDLKGADYVRLGGIAMGKVPSAVGDATILAELPGGAMKAEQAADVALGTRLRAYSFDRYKTKPNEDDPKTGSAHVTIGVAEPGPHARPGRRARLSPKA